jgi:hypothetical protein
MESRTISRMPPMGHVAMQRYGVRRRSRPSPRHSLSITRISCTEQGESTRGRTPQHHGQPWVIANSNRQPWVAGHWPGTEKHRRYLVCTFPTPTPPTTSHHLPPFPFIIPATHTRQQGTVVGPSQHHGQHLQRHGVLPQVVAGLEHEHNLVPQGVCVPEHEPQRPLGAAHDLALLNV